MCICFIATFSWIKSSISNFTRAPFISFLPPDQLIETIMNSFYTYKREFVCVLSWECNISKNSLSFGEKTNYRNSIKNAKRRAEAILDQFKKVIDETLIWAEGTVSRQAVTIPHTSLAAIISLVFQFVRTGGDNFTQNTNIKKKGLSDFRSGWWEAF